MEVKPLRAVSGWRRDDGNGVDGDGDDEKKSMVVVEAEREGSGPESKGIGAAASGLRREVVPKLTVSQAQELKQQLSILKYLESGIAVPPVLMYPIWNSVAASASCASANCGGDNDHHHINSLGQFSYSAKSRPLAFDFRNTIDSEPGRCRRTDGKKWRCSKKVLPDAKYCERHIHRGRQRSRKLVETSQTGSISDKPEWYKSSCCSARFAAGYLNLMPTSPSPKIPSPSDSSLTHKIGSTSMASGTMRTSISAAKCNATVNADTISRFVDSTSVASKKDKSNSICINCPDVDDKHRKCSNAVAYSSISLKASEPSITKASARNASTGLDFSPKSVLQDCSASCYYSGNLREEPQRCRRTDGKKWQCRKNVVPNQKYCERHVHRGVKKSIDAPQTTSFLPPVLSKSASLYPTANSNNTTNCSRLNSNLFISPKERPEPLTALSTSSTSSETTISDTVTASRRSK